MIFIKKNEKITTNFEPTDNSDVINKAYLDEKLKKIHGHISYIEKDYNELLYNKQSVEDELFQNLQKQRYKNFKVMDYLINFKTLMEF